MIKNFSDKELKQELERRKEANFVPHTFVIEGHWSGYRTEQRHICFRQYTKNKDYVKEVEKLRSIRYTDGTRLDLYVRPMKYREKKEKEILSYAGLVRDCIEQGVNSVAKLKEEE